MIVHFKNIVDVKTIHLFLKKTINVRGSCYLRLDLYDSRKSRYAFLTNLLSRISFVKTRILCFSKPFINRIPTDLPVYQSVVGGSSSQAEFINIIRISLCASVHGCYTGVLSMD